MPQRIVDALRHILTPGQYDVVVGNPPYITVKDKTLNARYRELYSTCKGTYALTVPFMERFFELAKGRDGDRPAGWTGQITSNSFMKREFGSRLIEEFLAKQDLRLVVDTSGAYIPGHGTPTVILVGRHQPPVGSTVRAVLGVRGEPGQPQNAAKGVVWTQIVENVARTDVDGDYVSVTGSARALPSTAHPWSLTGGGADSLSNVHSMPRCANDSMTSLPSSVVRRIPATMRHSSCRAPRNMSWLWPPIRWLWFSVRRRSRLRGRASQRNGVPV